MQINTLAYSSAVDITPSDGTPITCRAIYVGGTGNVAISFGLSSAAFTFTGVPAGTILPLMLDQGRIMATNTTGTLIIALA